MQTDNKNAGISLLEVIVVVAILGVLSGGVMLATGIGKWADASGAVNRIDSKMEQVKTLSMSKKDALYLAMYKKDDGYYVCTTKEISPFSANSSEEEKIAGNQMEVEVTFADGSTARVEEKAVYFSFERASGAFLTCYTAINGGTLMDQGLPQTIRASAKGRTSTIKMIPQTGKHYVE